MLHHWSDTPNDNVKKSTIPNLPVSEKVQGFTNLFLLIKHGYYELRLLPSALYAM